jgi:transposase
MQIYDAPELHNQPERTNRNNYETKPKSHIIRIQYTNTNRPKYEGNTTLQGKRLTRPIHNRKSPKLQNHYKLTHQPNY